MIQIGIVKIPVDFTVNTDNWLPAPLPYVLRDPVESLQELPRRVG